LSFAPGAGLNHAMQMIRSLVWGCLLALLAGRMSGQDAPPKQGAALLKTDLMGVFAHPDDETGMAATLAAYALGKQAVVANVYCTRGEGGGNMVGTQGGPALGVLREAELRDCLKELGVRYAYFLDREDFAYTESLAVTLEKWGHEETLRRLVRLVRALRPEVIVTMNPAPSPGQHGNHQAAGLLATEAFDAAADPDRFPEQLAVEGLSLWRPRKLYFGGGLAMGATIDVNQPMADGRTPAQVAGQALANHRSQGFGGFANAPWLRRPQSFTLAKGVVPFERNEKDLFRGLPVAGNTPPRLLAEGDAPPAADFDLRFVPRAPMEFYRQWSTAQQIGHVATRFATDLPVIAGSVNDVFLYTVNPAAEGVNTVVKFSVTPGWTLNFDEVNVRFSPARTNQMRVLVTPPAGPPQNGELTAVTTINGREFETKTQLHSVPLLKVPKLAGPLAMTGGDSPAWTALPAHTIAHTNIWQGAAKSPEDSSGTFRVAHDGQTLFIEVRVRDDQVVSNIEPDDIKGHWRSDSVELCLDPAGGAEHTLGCYKLGIFPFDTTGVVRAARDADANQGPVEKTAPGTRLASWKTADGYAIRAAIPFAEIGLRPTEQERQFGLNVLIYDGDKPNAARGENINKSRLAWSPRLGVQGRPEDWGRADLE